MRLQPARAAVFAKASAARHSLGRRRERARPAKWECFVDIFGPRGWGPAALMD